MFVNAYVMYKNKYEQYNYPYLAICKIAYIQLDDYICCIKTLRNFMYQIYQRKITKDLCTYRLKLRKGVSVVFMATLPMNVILKNELGI